MCHCGTLSLVLLVCVEGILVIIRDQLGGRTAGACMDTDAVLSAVPQRKYAL